MFSTPYRGAVEVLSQGCSYINAQYTDPRGSVVYLSGMLRGVVHAQYTLEVLLQVPIYRNDVQLCMCIFN